MIATIYRLSHKDYPWRYAVVTAYKAAFVAALKLAIPSRQRRWIPEEKLWWFRADVIETVEYLCDQFFGGYVHVGYSRKEEKSYQNARTDPAQPDAYQTLHLLPTAPPELIHAAYRTLAKLNHPDVGGATDAMQRLNAAYARLRK